MQTPQAGSAPPSPSTGATTQPAATATGNTASMLSKMLPEFSVVVVIAWMLFMPGASAGHDPQMLTFAAMADGGTLMFSATLIDVASRLSRKPPWWLGLVIAAGILLVYPDAIVMLQMAWAIGLWIFLPFAWSIIERLRELWTLPGASPLEKIRRRALTFDRLYTALILGGICVAAGIAVAIYRGGSLDPGDSALALPWLMLGFYSVATFNAWRVHQPKFAKRSRSLWPWIDKDQVNYLDPL